MTIQGLTAFCNYILYIYFRWTRLTFRRYGLWGVLSSSYRPRRAGVGYGSRIKPWEVAHRNLTGGVRVWSLIDRLVIEESRGIIA